MCLASGLGQEYIAIGASLPWKISTSASALTAMLPLSRSAR
jgi:hypothetical protein